MFGKTFGYQTELPAVNADKTIENIFSYLNSINSLWDMDTETKQLRFYAICHRKECNMRIVDLDEWMEQIHPEDREVCLQTLNSYIKHPVHLYENIYRIRTDDSQYSWIMSRAELFEEDGEKILRGFHIDITSMMDLHARMKLQLNNFETMYQNEPSLFLVLDTDGIIKEFNPYAEKLSGYCRQDVLGKNAIRMFIDEPDADSMFRSFRDLIGKQDRMQNFEVCIKTSDGETRYLLLNYFLLETDDRVLLTGVNITEQRRMMNQLHRIAYYDQLTGLPSQTMFRNLVDQELNMIAASGKHAPFLYIWISNLKYINEAIGPRSTDRFLIEFANLIIDIFGCNGIVGTVSPEVFCVLLRKSDCLQNSLNLLREALGKHFMIDGNDLYAAVSIGISIAPHQGNDYITLLRNAGIAMHYAAESGQNNYMYYSPNVHQRSKDHLMLNSQIMSALENDRFLQLYQPILELESGQIIGAEALIRMVGTNDKMIAPIDFIPFAEAYGLILPIEEWTLHQACMTCRKWQNMGMKDFRINVNLSSKSLMRDDLPVWIRSVAKKTGIECRFLEIEVTETAVMSDFKKAVRNLIHLKRMGISVALDDFGTGYSSLMYLSKLPIDILKLERHFVKDVMRSGKSSIIFQSVVYLAHNLGIKVVVEGIETQEQMLFFQKNDCDFGQGYLFSKPISMKEFEEKYLSKPCDP